MVPVLGDGIGVLQASGTFFAAQVDDAPHFANILIRSDIRPINSAWKDPLSSLSADFLQDEHDFCSSRNRNAEVNTKHN